MVFSASPLVVWQYLLFENGLSANLVLRIWENNASIFYLKTGFPFFLACDGNLWKIMPISSIWKRNFRVFSGLVMGTSFENGISVSFWAFLEYLLFENGISLFWACDGSLWKIISISSIWKRDFRCFFWACDSIYFRVFSGLVMGTSFENGISVSFLAFLRK